jgi:hypothetical protein
LSKTTVTLDLHRIKAKINLRKGVAQMALAQQVLKDSNFFIPRDSGDLEASGVIASNGSEVTWNTSYARAQYHGLPRKSKDSNPNASMKWFERAKSLWMQSRWLKIVKAVFHG